MDKEAKFRGETNEDPKQTTFLDLTLHLAKVVPDKEAFVFRRVDGTRYPLTWANYTRLGTRFAARLQGMGFGKGDVICNFLVNSPERVITELGTMLAGSVPVHGEVHLADGADIQKIFSKVDVKAAIVDPEHYIGERQALEIIETLFNSCPKPSERKIILSKRSTEDGLLLLKELEEAVEEWTPVALDLDDAAYIFSTSGSTGLSKLVQLTYGQIDNKAGRLRLLKSTADSAMRHFNNSSLGWISGAAVTQTWAAAARVLADVRAGHPVDFPRFAWEAIVQESCSTALLMTNTIYDIYRRPDIWQESCHLLDAISTGGQPLTKGAMAAIGCLCKSIVSTYSSTEIGILSAVKFTRADEFEEYMSGMPVVVVKIVDDSLEEVPRGTHGEILVKAEGLFSGYLGDAEATKKALTDDGWFRTNDLGYLDDRGRLFVMGRRSDVIMKGSWIIYPSWLEPRIRLHPRVADVIVVPVPDPVLFHEICACVIAKEGSDVSALELDDYCKTLFLSQGIVVSDINPKYFVFFTEFPVNKNNKIDRKLLARLAAEKVSHLSNHV